MYHLKAVKATTIRVCITLVALSVCALPGSANDLISDWLEGRAKPAYPEITYSGPAITLRYSHFIPSNSTLAAVQKRTFERLHVDSNGKLVVRAYWGNTLSDAQRGAFQAVSAKIADFGSCFVIFNPGSLSLHSGLQFPHHFSDSASGTAVATELYPKFLRKKYETRGVYLLRISTSPASYVAMAKDKVQGPGDLHGKKIWAAGEIQQKLAKALGAAAAPMAPTELFSALQSGTIDGVVFNDAGVKLFGLDEVIRFRTEVGLWVLTHEYCINKSVFDGLPDDLKQILLRWAQLASQAEAQLYYDDESKRARASFEKRGIVTVPIDGKGLDSFRAVTESVEREFVALTSAQGEPAAAFIEAISTTSKRIGALSRNQVVEELLRGPLPPMIELEKAAK